MTEASNPKQEHNDDINVQSNVNDRRKEREQLIDDAATQFARLFLRQVLRMRAEKAEQEKRQ